MTPETRHILFDWATRINEINDTIFAEMIGVTRQAVSQALKGRIKSQPILNKVDKYIAENMPKIKELIGDNNGLEIGAYRLSEYSPTSLLLQIFDEDEVMEIMKDRFVKVLDEFYRGG